ncbi:hypothetical protein [Streptomyces mangrovisoli]|uniref:Uncharacterized protein n=1 Tax=Streptomyces mangrovisoli TaxID=1428628 RepID=A0A1J4P6V3_9ACTN|nr:hypothetical protein [Streptomyces mangrovisoli]OIJ69246.1 hypothetical protein WN71_003095 [Streptomyces mangrovisoli]
MLRATVTHGRRGAAIGASAAVAVLGVALAACGGGAGGGYAAVGPADGPSGTPTTGPTGAVRLVPLDGASDSPRPGGGSGDSSDTSDRSGSRGEGAEDRESGAGGSPAAAAAGPGTDAGATAPSGAHGSHTSPTPTSSRTAAPAALAWSGPAWQAGDRRWCDEVTVEFRNSGGTPVRSGTVTFGTHIIGALGIDWATVTSTEDLPAPIGAGARTSATWTVCVDAWRVPLGMHVETRDASVRWT